MTANRCNINDLRYLTRNNLIIPNNLDIRKNRTVSYPDSALPLARARTLKFLNLPNCLYIKKSCKSFQSYEKSRAKQKEFILFFCRDGVSSPSLMAKVRLQWTWNFWVRDCQTDKTPMCKRIAVYSETVKTDKRLTREGRCKMYDVR